LILQNNIVKEFAGALGDDSDDDSDEMDRYVNIKITFSNMIHC
jgi:hypothetical protein